MKLFIVICIVFLFTTSYATANWDLLFRPSSDVVIRNTAVSSDQRIIVLSGCIKDSISLGKFHPYLTISRDSGKTWNRAITPLDSVVGDETNASLYETSFGQNSNLCLAVGGYGSIIKSLDGGRTWSKMKGIVGNAPLRTVNIAWDNPEVLFAYGEYSWCFLSTDGGSKWNG